METKYTFFWNGPFSQWHQCEFIDRQTGQMFNSAEQWMMYHKAIVFKDYESAQKIMQSSDPRFQKKVGREVKNYNDIVWSENRERIVREGNRLKFTQNKGLLLYLKDTVGTTLVEASPYDTIWGVGLAKEDPRILDSKNWRGLNLLGKILTELRVELLGE